MASRSTAGMHDPFGSAHRPERIIANVDLAGPVDAAIADASLPPSS